MARQDTSPTTGGMSGGDRNGSRGQAEAGGERERFCIGASFLRASPRFHSHAHAAQQGLVRAPQQTTNPPLGHANRAVVRCPASPASRPRRRPPQGYRKGNGCEPGSISSIVDAPASGWPKVPRAEQNGPERQPIFPRNTQTPVQTHTHTHTHTHFVGGFVVC